MAAAVVLADQVTKSLAQTALQRHPVHVIGPFDLRLVYNTGAAFSMGRGLGPALAILAVLAAAAIVVATRTSSSHLAVAAGGLVAGGAVGNLADRVFRHNGGAVIDFVYTGFWPTFNVADSCITAGIVVLLWSTFRSSRGARPSGNPVGGTPGGGTPGGGNPVGGTPGGGNPVGGTPGGGNP